MRLTQFSIPAHDIELLRYWYMRYFAMSSSDRTMIEDNSPAYRLTCPDDTCSLTVFGDSDPHTASRLAISVASKQGVDFVTELLRTDGNRIVTEAGTDGFGIYRSTVLDPEGNRVDVTE